MKQYKIKGTILLDFLTPQEQVTSKFQPTDGFILECDGSTIWIKAETINQANLIGHLLKQGLIEEIEES